MPPAVRPLPDEPALAIPAGADGGAAVAISDLHLGLGSRPELPQGQPGASAPELADDLLRLCRSARARTLLILGDIKHPIVGVPAWLRPVVFEVFATLLSARIVPEIILGNHDVGLVRHLPREVVVHPATGCVRNRVGLFHGHRWPAAEVLAQRTAVVGHLHPGYRFAPTSDLPLGKRKCWVRARFEETPVLGPDRAPARLRELIVLPAFHPLAGTEALNREQPERGRSFLYRRFLGCGRTRAYLLDGTDLGPLPSWDRPDPNGPGG